MVKLLSLLVLSIALFVGGLAAALYLRPMLGTTDAANTAHAGDAGKSGDASAVKETVLPVVLPGRPMSTDDVFRFTASIRARERELKRRDAQLEQRESRLKMMQEDLRGERLEIDGLMEQLQDTMERTVLALEDVKAERAQLRSDRSKATQDLQQAKLLHQKTDAIEAANIKKMSEWVQGMPEETAAAYVTNLVNNGEVRQVAQVLQNVEPRNVAKILSSVDQDLIVQIMEEYRRFQPPLKPERR